MTTPTRRRRSPLRILLALLAMLGACYLAAIFWLMSQETRLIFQAGRPLGEGRPPFPFTQVDIPRADGARQFGWVIENPDARTWLLANPPACERTRGSAG